MLFWFGCKNLSWRRSHVKRCWPHGAKTFHADACGLLLPDFYGGSAFSSAATLIRLQRFSADMEKQTSLCHLRLRSVIHAFAAGIGDDCSTSHDSSGKV